MTSENIPRNHHYVPQMFLKRFAREDGKLMVFDGETRRNFPANPRDVACERDLYKVTLRDDPMIAEKTLARVEAIAEPILESVVEAKTLPSDGQREALLYFVALLATRRPHRKRNLQEFVEKVADLTVATLVQHPQILEAEKERLVAAGYDVADLTREGLLESSAAKERGELRFDMDPTWLVGQMFAQADAIAPYLYARSWAVLASPSAAFITGDSPVALHFLDRRAGAFDHPGFGLRDTVVVASLSPHVALWGTFDGPEGQSPADLPAVATTNGLILLRSERWLYAATERFDFSRGQGIQNSDELMRRSG
jgi:hypothetical protein